MRVPLDGAISGYAIGSGPSDAQAPAATISISPARRNHDIFTFMPCICSPFNANPNPLDAVLLGKHLSWRYREPRPQLTSTSGSNRS